MKTILRGALAALLTMLVAGAAQAEEAHPALWKVQRGDTTIYLFGTTHALKPEVTWFDGPIKAAFEQSQELVLEVIEPEPARMAAIVGTATTSDARPLIDRLPEKERAAYAQRLTSFGLPPAAFDRFDPWFAMVNFSGLALRKAGYNTDLSCEHILVAA